MRLDPTAKIPSMDFLQRHPSLTRLLGWIITLLMLQGAFVPLAVATDAKGLIQQAQDLLRSNTSIARYTMRIEAPDWQREMRLDSWDDRPNKRFFIRILAPRKDRNTTWLKDGVNLWMYLPRLERDIRIPPSMMLSGWMGSDFTNDDLVKMESMVEDYTHRIVAEDASGFTVESLAKPDAPVVWGKVIHRIGRDGIPRSDAYYE